MGNAGDPAPPSGSISTRTRHIGCKGAGMGWTLPYDDYSVMPLAMEEYYETGRGYIPVKCCGPCWRLGDQPRFGYQRHESPWEAG
jgi:hypothetical protein